MNGGEQGDLEAKLAGLRQELEASRRLLIESHKMMSVGELLAGIVHEINTPIGSILSNNEVSTRCLEMLASLLAEAPADGGAPPPKAAQILDTLQKLAAVDKIACERIAAVVRGLKTFAGGTATEYRMTDVNEVLDNTIKLAHCEFRRRIRVETRYGELPEVECDPHQIGQVFLNLLVNAGQAICGEGIVTVTTEPIDGDRVHIAIADTGCGIAPEHRDKIFTSGFTTKAPGIGTGLGLAISKEIVEKMHGGTIDFESGPEGTTFHIRIPVRRTPGEG